MPGVLEQTHCNEIIFKILLICMKGKKISHPAPNANLNSNNCQYSCANPVVNVMTEKNTVDAIIKRILRIKTFELLRLEMIFIL